MKDKLTLAAALTAIFVGGAAITFGIGALLAREALEAERGRR